MSRSLMLAAIAALMAGGAQAQVTAHDGSIDPYRGRVYDVSPPMNVTVSTRVTPQVERLLGDLQSQGRSYALDGVEVFAANDRFLPGKIAISMAHVLSSTPRDDPKFASYLNGFRDLSELTVEDPNESWGIYYYVSALHELQTAGLLDQAVSPEVLARLREKLDWRRFVREDDLTLIDLPNNYYGVAFSVARLRFLLGWEDASASEALLAKTLDHFREYSGEYGFADETNGDGRFDRYSVLLIGEIAQRFIETGVEPPEDVRAWLRKSVDLMLPRLNLRGEGFEYGRSIGPYGETAFVEVLSAAAALGVLTDEEGAMAYAFSSRVAARYADYWIDPGTASVNLWAGGRGTDGYRGKHRVLGENLSLGHQLFYTNAVWNRLGYQDRTPDAGFEAWLGRLQRSTTTWFARGDYDRLLVTYRDGARVIGLPLINGGAGQHMNTPYYPIPFSPGVLAGTPDRAYPQLLPRLTLDDGSVLMPLAYFEDVTVTSEGDRTIVTYTQSALDRMGENAPAADRRVAIETRYELSPGRITRTDSISPRDGARIARIDTVFATFSRNPRSTAKGVSFSEGEVTEFSATGLECRQTAPDPAINLTPVGAQNAVVTCSATPEDGVVSVGWTLSLRESR